MENNSEKRATRTEETQQSGDSSRDRLVYLIDLAVARSGDKGRHSNIGVIARDPRFYPILVEQLTEEKVKEHMGPICAGRVHRYLLPTIHSMNFLLEDSLDGGGTLSLRLDSQGKTHASRLLQMMLAVPEGLEIVRMWDATLASHPHQNEPTTTSASPSDKE